MKIIKNKKRILITIAILGVVIVLIVLFFLEKKSEREKLDYERGPQTQLPHESFVFHEAKNGMKDTATDTAVIISNALTINEKDLLGNWTIHIVDQDDDPECKHTPKEIGLCDPNDAEQIQFSMVNGKREFNSWIHSHPEEVRCFWVLNGETITISCKDSSSVNDSKIISLSTTTLTIDAGGGFSPGVYYRSH